MFVSFTTGTWALSIVCGFDGSVGSFIIRVYAVLLLLYDGLIKEL